MLRTIFIFIDFSYTRGKLGCKKLTMSIKKWYDLASC